APDLTVPSSAVRVWVWHTGPPASPPLPDTTPFHSQAPAELIENEPYEPAVPACATKVAGLSPSLMVRVPEVEMSAAASVSVRLAVAEERTAASLVPAMLMGKGGRLPSSDGATSEAVLCLPERN